MTFTAELSRLESTSLLAELQAITPEMVVPALGRDDLTWRDLVALFSPAADSFLEQMARRSQEITRRRFGRVIALYAPLYLSSSCVNSCTYCGFSRSLAIPRQTLTPDAVMAEANLLYDQGFRHLLLVSGEDPRAVSSAYLRTVLARLRGRFASLAIEISPLGEVEYGQLVRAGVDGLALYQETYDPELYRQYHPAGPKRDFAARLGAIEAGGKAGMRTLGVGALLGLAPWRQEALRLVLHARYLSRRFWRSRLAVSFPRLRPHAGTEAVPHPVEDRDLVHLICALRLALPDAELVLSTREGGRLRDRLLALGITRMSAGSSTIPGGYSLPEQERGSQFAIADDRSAAAVAKELVAQGFEPVWKDFDRAFLAEDH